MTEIEALIEILAIILGFVAIFAPVITVLLQSRRSKGSSVGKAAGFRTWPGILVTTACFIGIGCFLWRPFPLINTSKGVILLITIVGAIIYFPGVSLYLWSLATMHSQFGVSGLLGAELYQGHKLVTNGPFAVIRHPMYMGVLLAAIGALLIFKTWAMVIFLPMSLVVVVRSRHEEKLLEQEFGDEWRSYALKVPKWFPKSGNCEK